MRIAFYAPLKPPDDPIPSGDREMARRLIQALEACGHEVTLASRLRSRDASGDAARQQRLRTLGAALAARLVRRVTAGPPDARPQAWLTYHLYYKAADWLGPAVADALGIPYVIAEASFAPKRAGGPWDVGHRGAEAAIGKADAVVAFNRIDMACVHPLMRPGASLEFLPPFTDTAPFTAAAAARARHRAEAAERYGLDPAAPLLLAVAMMREGDKLASYDVLARALARLAGRPWQLLVIGDGPARETVTGRFAAIGPGRVVFAGEAAPAALPAIYAAADLLVWPAVREAYGMALLEGQAAGLPVVAGRAGGVPGIVRDGETGLLTEEGDAAAFADAIAALLDAPSRRGAMSVRACQVAARDHGLAAAGRRLSGILSTAAAERSAA